MCKFLLFIILKDIIFYEGFIFRTSIRKLWRFVILESLPDFICCIMRRPKHLRQQRLVLASLVSEAGDLLKNHELGSGGSLSA